MRPNPFVLPFSVPVWAGVGYMSGNSDVSPKMCALIFAISEIADVALFAVVALSGDGGWTIRDIYSYTGLVVDATTVLAMYHFNLIHHTGAAVLTGLSIWHFLSRFYAPLETYG